MSYITLKSESAGVLVNMNTITTVEWIPVTAEFPPPDKIVLASIVGGYPPVWPVIFEGKEWRDAHGWLLNCTVTHWAHLPMGMHPARPV